MVNGVGVMVMCFALSFAGGYFAGIRFPPKVSLKERSLMDAVDRQRGRLVSCENSLDSYRQGNAEQSGTEAGKSTLALLQRQIHDNSQSYQLCMSDIEKKRTDVDDCLGERRALMRAAPMVEYVDPTSLNTKALLQIVQVAENLTHVPLREIAKQLASGSQDVARDTVLKRLIDQAEASRKASVELRKECGITPNTKLDLSPHLAQTAATLTAQLAPLAHIGGGFGSGGQPPK